MNNLALVSVIIPTYRRAAYLDRAIQSVLGQTYPDIEILVIDDNDPESEFRYQTQKLMQRYRLDSRVHYICHPKNLNGAAARNTGIQNARGKWCCFLDDDDWYLPEKIAKQVSYLSAHKEYQAVYCGYARDNKKVIPYKTGDLTFEILSGVETIYTNTILIDRMSAMEFGGWDERFKRNQEAAFLLRYFSNGGKIGVVSEILVQFDISDSFNRSKPKQFEQDFAFFLNTHQKEIDRCVFRYPEAREMIYSYRYRGILLNYIKHGGWSDAVRLYKEMSKMLPKRFTGDCLIYIKRRILRQPLFREFDRRNGPDE